MDSAVYQELIRRAARDGDVASYVLLLEACKKTLEEAPATIEHLDTLDIKDVLSTVLARMGETITRIVPYKEFYFYTSDSLLQNQTHRETAAQQKWKFRHGG